MKIFTFIYYKNVLNKLWSKLNIISSEPTLIDVLIKVKETIPFNYNIEHARTISVNVNYRNIGEVIDVLEFIMELERLDHRLIKTIDRKEFKQREVILDDFLVKDNFYFNTKDKLLVFMDMAGYFLLLLADEEDEYTQRYFQTLKTNLLSIIEGLSKLQLEH